MTGGTKAQIEWKGERSRQDKIVSAEGGFQSVPEGPWQLSPAQTNAASDALGRERPVTPPSSHLGSLTGKRDEG
ncbi:MAG: hypothetical protein K9M57_05915 [Phycisphaerae bacterium]|nr:hypothetical protein [Phycisphaerae bacterium]